MVVALTLVVAPFLTGTAQAVSTCVWDPGTALLQIFPDEEATLAVSGQDILLDGLASCAPPGATTATIDRIAINGAVGNDQTFTLDLSGGPFAPGAEVEGTGEAEIEFFFQVGDGMDQVVINGTSSADDFEFGQNGANLNNDDDVDAVFGGVEEISSPRRSGR